MTFGGMAEPPSVDIPSMRKDGDTLPVNTCHGASAPTVVDSFPDFTPSTYQNCERDDRLWQDSYATATTSQLLARAIAALPQHPKLAGMAYRENTGTSPRVGTMQALVDMLGERCGRTDYERSYAWLAQFTESPKAPSENIKDFRARFTRATTPLETLRVEMSI